jgi:hypothetical protein
MSEPTECIHELDPAWCSICLHGHGAMRVGPQPRDTGVGERQAIIDGLTNLSGHPTVITQGASEPKSVLVAVVNYLDLPVDTSAAKPALAASIVTLAGMEWDDLMDSSSTPSGGGSAITNRGMLQLLKAVRQLAPTAVHG